MARSELTTASDLLESAADDTGDDDASERLGELAGQLERLSTADHGRLARIQSALNELKTGNGADVAEAIGNADNAINEFRSDLDGV